MSRWTPDPTFYPLPGWRWGAARGARLRRAPQPGASDGRPDALAASWTSTRAPPRTASWSAAWTCPTPATSCTTSAGTPAAPRSARTRRTRTSSAATCWCPGLRSSRIYVVDTKPDPRSPTHRQDDRAGGAGAQDRLQPAAHRPLRPGRRSTSARSAAPDGDGPGRHLPAGPRDASTCWGAWEVDRGPQYLAYDFWWHLGHDTLITSEWGTPNMVENGVDPGAAARRQVRPPAARLGPAQRAGTCRRSTSAPSTRWCWSCARRTTRRKAYGFVGVVVSRRGPLGLDLALAPRRRRRGRSRR